MNKIALITGGSRGIGKATADMLRGKDWEVAAPSRDQLDLSVYGSTKYFASAWNAAPHSLPLNALILCAGEWFSAPLEKIGDADYLKQFRVFLAHQNIMRAFLPRLAEARGCLYSCLRRWRGDCAVQRSKGGSRDADTGIRARVQ